MIKSLKLYYQLRKIWIWFAVIIVSLLSFIYLFINATTWHQVKYNFDNRFSAHDYYRIKDFAARNDNINDSLKIVDRWNGKAPFQEGPIISGNSSDDADDTNISRGSLTDSDRLLLYISLIDQKTLEGNFTMSGSKIHKYNFYKRSIKILPETFSEYRKKVLFFDVAHPNRFELDPNVPASRNSYNLFLRQVLLPTNRIDPKYQGQPFGSQKTYLTAFKFPQSLGIGAFLGLILFTAITFLIDQSRGINAYMLKQLKNGSYIAFTKGFWLFFVPSLATIFSLLLAYFAKIMFIPAKFLDFSPLYYFSVILEMFFSSLLLFAFEFLIDSFFGSIFGKIYASFAAFIATILFLFSTGAIFDFFNNFLRLNLHFNWKFLKNINEFFDQNFFGYLAPLVLSIIIIALALRIYRSYSIESDNNFVRSWKIRKAFFAFVFFLSVWIFWIPVLIRLVFPSWQSSSFGNNVSGNVWWVVWGFIIIAFNYWMIFQPNLSFDKLKRKLRIK
ncbi:hypothetical protein ACKP2L_00880 [Oenococcus alcoholitolerans]|uniref:hypothetical protein n=1 Tax=Oenococcus alcoholitolerans TaxID=931074 RepID=UPI003F701A10